MDNSNLTPEFMEKAKDLSGDDLLALAEQEGIELTDEQLEAVSGGWTGKSCPKCGSMNTRITGELNYACSDCDYEW